MDFLLAPSTVATAVCIRSSLFGYFQASKMQYSSDEISVDSDHLKQDGSRGLKYLPHWPAVNIEFQDLVYTVPDISGE